LAGRSILAALLLPALPAPQDAAPTSGSSQAGPAPATTPLVRSPGNAEWAATLAEARARAASEKKLVFVEFGQENCGNCRRMDALLYPAFDFEALLVGMVPVKLGLDEPEGQSTARRYEIAEAPSILVVNPDGRLVFLMQGFQDAPGFYGHIRKDLDSYRAFARRIDAQDVGKLTAAEALESGRDLYQRRDPGAALPRLERVASAPDATPAGLDSARELAAAAQLDLGKTADSRKTIESLISTTKDPDCRERAEIFRAQLPLAEGKPEEALRLFEAFRKAHPQSKYAAGVDEVIQRLAAAGRTK
jgi:hypothetical protein